MSKLVAIETATPASSVSLGIGPELVSYAERVDPRGHAGFVVAALDFCLEQAGWDRGDFDAVVVDVGPGLYTGIRVGLATAQGLAAALGIPVIPVSSLDAIALRAATRRRVIWAVVDIRRAELAVCSYRPVPGGVVIDSAPEVTTHEQLHAQLESSGDEILLVGDVEELDDGFLRGLHRVKTGRPRFPTAEALLELGAGKLARGEIPGADDVRPLYMREPDVTINWSALRSPGPWGEAEAPG